MPVHAPIISECWESSQQAAEFAANGDLREGEIVMIPSEQVIGVVVCGVLQAATGNPGPRFVRALSPSQWLENELSIEILAPLARERGWKLSYLVQRVIDANDY